MSRASDLLRVGAAVLEQEHGDTFSIGSKKFSAVLEYSPVAFDSFEAGPDMRIDGVIHLDKALAEQMGMTVGTVITKADSSQWRVLVVDKNPGDVLTKLYCRLDNP